MGKVHVDLLLAVLPMQQLQHIWLGVDHPAAWAVSVLCISWLAQVLGSSRSVACFRHSTVSWKV
jgi:hypothetical protein